ncbi:MAG: hypothetical protein AAF495_05815 [Pseudomonadota bacterium]
MTSNPPRAVFVTRETDYQLLLARHATREQARFFLKTRGQSLEELESRHQRFERALHLARGSVPREWRQTSVLRKDFDRFLFGPEDVIVAVGQDGLVANIAKYLNEQPVLGINPDSSLYDGMLVRFTPEQATRLLPGIPYGDCGFEHLTMAEAKRDDGERIVALNEVFIGHASHQSARYEVQVDDRREFQSSSGLIVATGTGASGWARSIMESTGIKLPLSRDERALDYFVREPFPSVANATTIRAGRIDLSDHLTVVSRLNDGGVVFADGIEQDFLSFDWGRTIKVGVAERAVHLVTCS